MKKLLLFFNAALVALTSCSKAQNDSQQSNSDILPKNITFTENDGNTY